MGDQLEGMKSFGLGLNGSFGRLKLSQKKSLIRSRDSPFTRLQEQLSKVWIARPLMDSAACTVLLVESA